MKVAIAKMSLAGVTKDKEYKVFDIFGDSVLIILDNGKKAFRNVNNFSLVSK